MSPVSIQAVVRDLTEVALSDEHSAKFVAECFDRIQKYGDTTIFTWKQSAWLRSLWVTNCEKSKALLVDGQKLTGLALLKHKKALLLSNMSRSERSRRKRERIAHVLQASNVVQAVLLSAAFDHAEQVTMRHAKSFQLRKKFRLAPIKQAIEVSDGK